jgi:hypothetical protein
MAKPAGPLITVERQDTAPSSTIAAAAEEMPEAAAHAAPHGSLKEAATVGEPAQSRESAGTQGAGSSGTFTVTREPAISASTPPASVVEAAEPPVWTIAAADAERHLALWNRLRRPDPRATKPFTRARAGSRGTPIDPTWRLQVMTELFGPIGQGWGYEQLDWTVQERMVFVCARAWYRDPETGTIHHTGPQWGGTEIIRRRAGAGAATPNDECFKTAITVALGKCLQELGLAADVHLGQFEDSKYRDDAEADVPATKQPDLPLAAIASFESEVKTKLAAVADTAALNALWRSGVSARLRAIGTIDKAAQQQILALFSHKKAELLGRATPERDESERSTGDPNEPRQATEGEKLPPVSPSVPKPLSELVTSVTAPTAVLA